MTRLAISNIAWETAEDERVLDLLGELRVDGIELAPTKLWPEWQGITPASVASHRERLAARGLAIPALQAIFFGKPDCQLLGTPEQRRSFTQHLLLVASIARDLGARSLVFGAPKNRLRGPLDVREATSLAADVLGGVLPEIGRMGVWVGLEPNPPVYGGDFVLSLKEAIDVVTAIDSPHLGVHLDTGALITTGEELGEVVRAHRPRLNHFHVSEPMLADFRSASPRHADFARTLAAMARPLEWISIEMRRHDVPDSIASAIAFVRKTYLGVASA